MSMSTTDQGRLPRFWWLMVALIAGAFLVVAYGQLRLATAPSWEDTDGYLAHSLYIAEHGGLLGFLRQSFAGTFLIVERHPLYMLMLAPFASRTAEFFLTAKLINVGFGAAALLTVVWMMSRRYGRGPAILAGILYGMSNSLVIASSHVNHESMFTLCTLWTWWFLTQPRDAVPLVGASSAESADAAARMGENRVWASPLERLSSLPAVKRWAIAGAFLGLAYLVKSPASLFGVSIAAAGVWYARARFITNPRIWVLVAVTFVVASPIFVRNVIAFGTPVHEGINTHITWLDDWSDIGSEQSIIYYDNYGIMTIERNGLPTAKTYIQTHSVEDIAKRLVKGVITEVTRVAPAALMPALPLPQPIGKAIAFLVLGFAIAGWWLRRRTWEASLVLFWSAAFIVFFGWDRMFANLRYLAPLVPVWIGLAAYAAWRLGQRLAAPKILWRVQAAAVAVFVVAMAGSAVASGSLTRAVPIIGATPEYRQLVDWMNNNIEPGDRVLLGPTVEYYGLLWMIHRPVNVVLTPNSTTLESFQRYLRERNVRYFVVHPENAFGDRGRLKEALEPYFAVEDGAIVQKQPFPGWRAVASDSTPPRRFIILEAVRAAS